MNKPTLIFATNNSYKVEEIKKIIGEKIFIITLKDAGINIDIPEPHETLEANATEKSNTIHMMTGQNCFGEDTGLEVESLNNEPGVKSARYAGEEKKFQSNIDKLLLNLNGIKNRNARFRTVISLTWNEATFLFVGICNGKIIEEKRGESGFGYDPIFIPEGSHKTFAEMTMNEKNIYSHRRKAMNKLIAFLESQ